MSHLSTRVQQIKPSATLAVAAKARELNAQGKSIISLSTGEPDFDTPEHIKAAADQAIKDGLTKYTPVDGIPELKQAIIAKLKRDNQLNYQAEHILVSVGAKQAIYNLLQALVNSGDEVIIPAPFWVSYPDMVKLSEGTPVLVTTDINNQFKITPEQLEANITTNTKLVMLNSPSNPTGVAYTKAELKALGDVLIKHPHVYIMTDDIYEHILWGSESFHNIVMVNPELHERTIVINGVSKAYAMTGWRIGYAAGPAAIIAAMKKIQSQSTSGACSIAQAAAVAALNDDQGCITAMVTEFKKRHDYIVNALNAIHGVKCLAGDGTFYAFPCFQGVIDNNPAINNDVELAEFFITKAQVATVPGSAFGAPGYLRLSFATSMEKIEAAINHINACLS